MKIVFIVSFLILFYTLFGYGIIAYIIVKIKKLVPKKYAPLKFKSTVSLIVAAYNEEDILEQKFFNGLDQIFPVDRIEFLFITDGSTDNSVAILKKLQKRYNGANIKIMHQDVRAGKTAALNRAIPEASGDILIFTDANTFINDTAVKFIVSKYSNPEVGAVAGEKRVNDNGEGLYWKYESFLKKLDYALYSAVGAAGELFSIRKDLYRPQPNDTILDDFMITMDVVKQGYKIAYAPEAYAIEDGSANYKEEFKRKVRIAAGGVQSMLRLKMFLLPISIFNIQYISRKVLRWSLCPIAIIMMFVSNLHLALTNEHWIWKVLLIGQILTLYVPTLLFLIKPKESSFAYKSFYFLFMHYAIIRGWIRYIFSTQNAAWERSVRKPTT